MKRFAIVPMLLPVLVIAGSCTAPPPPPAAAPPREPAAPPRAQVPSDLPPLEAKYLARVDALLPGMGASSLVDREPAQQELEGLCFQLGRPDADAERAALCRAMLARLGPETAPAARIWMLRQLERINGRESVRRLGELLADSDPQVREHARLCLQRCPSPAATEVLRAAYDQAEKTEWRVALLNALAARRDPGCRPRFLAAAKAPEPELAAAGIAALGELGAAAAVADLLDLLRAGPPCRDPAAHALLRVADRNLPSQGAQPSRAVPGPESASERTAVTAVADPAAAARIYEEIYAAVDPPVLRLAALHGIAAAGQPNAIDKLLAAIRGGSGPELQVPAVRLLGELPGSDVTRALAAELAASPPEVQAAMLDTLGLRGDAAAKPMIMAALASDESSVRIAALHALESLGGAEDLARLALAGAAATGAEAEAARRTLARLRGQDVDRTILQLIAAPELAADARAVLVRSVADRYCPAVAALLTAARDPQPPVRQAAFEALGRQAGADEAARLVGLLITEPDDSVREAAESAVVAVALKEPDREQRVAAVLAGLPVAQPPGKVSLLNVLGRVQGNAALAAIRAALQESDAGVVEAAIRALAGWEDAGVLDDLLPLARTAEPEAHRIIALRGYVRLLRLPSARPPEQTLARVREAFELAPRDEERKLVLAALGGVTHPQALALARQHMAEPALRDEAAVAVVGVARGLFAQDLALARGAIDEVLAAPVGDAPRQQAQAALELLKNFAGYVAQWEFAGPYAEHGKGFGDVFAAAYPPEGAEGAGVNWQPLAAAQADNPWLFDLTRVGGGSNCCIYVRTQIRALAAQPARLDLGSDDALKVWLNGELVHSKLATRPLSPGEDKVNVRLQEGVNTLLLKVVQSSGGWGFCCGVRGPDGAPLENLQPRHE